jgi:hypothetical protein
MRLKTENLRENALSVTDAVEAILWQTTGIGILVETADLQCSKPVKRRRVNNAFFLKY